MAEWLRRLALDQKVRGSISGSKPLCICHYGGSSSHIQTLEVYFHCLLPRLTAETLYPGPESIAYLVPARYTKHLPSFLKGLVAALSV